MEYKTVRVLGQVKLLLLDLGFASSNPFFLKVT